MTSIKFTTLVFAAAGALCGCSYLPSMPTLPSMPSAERVLEVVKPYRMEIVQGNVVTQEQADRLKPGMTRVQVRDLIGSPLITDPFHNDRWDYVFTIRRQGAEPQRRAVMLTFENDKLKTIDAPPLPSEREFVASVDTFRPSRAVPSLALTDEQRKALPVPVPQPASAPGPQGVARDYPPLEPRS